MIRFQELSRCLAVSSVLLLAACGGDPVPPGTLNTMNSMINQDSVAPTVAPDKATFAFEQFTGIPGNAGDDLARAIAQSARSQNINLVRRVGAPSTYRVQGYLSAVGDKYTTTVFYVFDIMDNNGNRLHRIQGQEQSEGGSGDPWASVGNDSLRRVAARAVASISAWVNSG